MTEWKYGQLATATKDMEIDVKSDDGCSIRRYKIPAGHRIIIGFDGKVHHMDGWHTQPLSDAVTLKGFSRSGVTVAVYQSIMEGIPRLDEMDKTGLLSVDLYRCIDDALANLGMDE